MEEYKKLISNHNNLKKFIDQQFICMIDGAIQARNPDEQKNYILNHETQQIGYVEQDHYSYNLAFGYKTAFSYYYQNGEGNINDQRLAEIKGINVKCGRLSYEMLINEYQQMFGLTGTYASLHQKNKMYLQNYFENFCLIPTCFNREKITESLLLTNSQADQFVAIANIIYNTSVPALIFFKDHQILDAFKDYIRAEQLNKDSLIILKQNINLDELNNKIKNATYQHSIALIDRSFGRGTDFICHDPEINDKGGIMAIQTFFSLDEAEEVQIKGRVGRQDKKGQYQLILSAEELQNNFDYNIQIQGQHNFDHEKALKWDKLKKFRKQKYGDQLDTLNEKIEQCKAQHNNTKKYFKSLKCNEQEQSLKLFLQFNLSKTQSVSQNAYQFIFLLDESASMSHKDGTDTSRWEKVMNAMKAFLSQRKQLINNNNWQNQDTVSIIYYNGKSRIICQQESIQNAEQKLVKPQGGNTIFSQAIKEIKNVIIKDNLKAIVLFLSDGMDNGDNDLLKNELITIKNDYENICRWWNIGFGPQVEKKVMNEMVEIMESNNCDAQFKLNFEAEELIENFENLASDERLHF